MSNDMEIKGRIEQLRKEISYHNYLYYVKHEPVISDEEFDFLVKELEKLEKEYPQFDDPNSPTHKPGADLTGALPVYEHSIPMGSIDNVYSFKEFEDFHNRIKNTLQGKDFYYIVEPKIDGVAIALIYKNGRFFRALTRGDGLRGEDVTYNVRTIKSVPLYLVNNREDMNDIEVRGEIFFTKERFEEIKDEYGFSNARNAAAGTLKLLSPKEVEKRGLSLIIHTIANIPERIQTHKEAMEELNNIGFPVANPIYLAHTPEEVKNIYDDILIKRYDLPFELDGIVIKINEFENRDILGETSKGPKWVIAYKFPAEKKEAKLIKVIWQVGRTGVVTPVGELEPIKIGGVIVKRVTLHNADEVERLGLYEGDTVIVERAGDVIPHIIGVNKSKRLINSKKIIPPSACPACGSLLVKLPDEVAIRCINQSCPAQLKKKIEHFASRDAMDIKGLGEKVVELLVSSGNVNNIADLYYIDPSIFFHREGWGTKSIMNLLSAIEESKEREFYRLVYGLGIRYVGIVNAKELAEYFRDMDALMNADEEEIKRVQGIGEAVAISIRKFFTLKDNIKIINRLKKVGLNMSVSEDGGPLKGEVWVLTGSMEKMSRSEAYDKIISLGGGISNTISSKTTALIVGKKPGSKLEKAKKHGIRIIEENEFYDILNRYGIDI